MSLNDLNNNIYNPKADLSGRNRETNQFDPFRDRAEDKNPFLQENNWQEEKKGLTMKQKKIIGILSGVLAVVIIAVGSFVFISYKKRNAFQEDKISVSFSGPTEIDSAQAVSYLIKYKNNNSITLKNVELNLSYPENFQPNGESNVNLKQLNATNSRVYIGDIKAHSEGEFNLTGVFYAPKDTTLYLRAALKYSPSGLSSEYEMKNQTGVSITTSPMLLEAVAPIESASGDMVAYVVDYKNLDKKSLTDAQLHIAYPDGFEFITSEPLPSKDKNIWYFGMLDSQQGGKITIRGKLKGASGEEKLMKVQLGKIGSDGQFISYGDREKSTRIIESALFIEQILDGNPDLIVNNGDMLRYVIRYGNKGSFVLKDIIVQLELKSDILDKKKVEIDKGYFDLSTNIITWKSSDLPQLLSLDPGTTGEISFSVPVVSDLKMKDSEDKNFIINSVAKIDSSNYLDPSGVNKIVVSNELNLKLNSKVYFETGGFYTDSDVKNYGPMPMTVGKETSFAIHWSVANSSNDLTGARVVSSLPTGVKWTGRIYPSGENIKYDERTNEVVWEIGNVSAGSGFYNSNKEVVFQVAVVPQENQVKEELKLVNVSQLFAKDSFTGRDVNIENKEKTTQLQEDKTINSAYYKVSSGM
ncbi:MAG: hypothetical protein ACD_11C00012G0002 [uncultured bacterium]|nr:MAG: hypothetical protein ACD_11C00012G0002 [uncultured bacterium]HBR71683.1 hypothetical protein [Candidatus Moranbacteria bacterium]